MSRRFDPIVVGTDGSEYADRAVMWAADEAALRGRPLRIVHALGQWTYAAPGAAYGSLDQLDDISGSLLRTAQDLALSRQPNIDVTTVEGREDWPASMLRRQARGAFEVVVGHRGRGGFASMLLGSTGLQVAGRVPVPVVVVRGHARPGAERIAVGIDPAGTSGAALEYAFEAAALRGARLTVAHAWQPPPRSQVQHHSVYREAEENARWTAIRVTAELRKRYSEVIVIEEVVCDHPVAALAEVSRRVDLLVVGSHERGPLTRPRLGSVSHGVIHHAECPVAVVPAALSVA